MSSPERKVADCIYTVFFASSNMMEIASELAKEEITNHKTKKEQIMQNIQHVSTHIFMILKKCNLFMVHWTTLTSKPYVNIRFSKFQQHIFMTSSCIDAVFPIFCRQRLISKQGLFHLRFHNSLHMQKTLSLSLHTLQETNYIKLWMILWNDTVIDKCWNTKFNSIATFFHLSFIPSFAKQ